MNIKLKYNEISQSVIAIYSLSYLSSGDNLTSLSKETLDNYIKQCGFDHFYQLEDAKKEFIRGVSRNQNISKVICQKKDAVLKISVNNEEVQAYLTYFPACGGKNASFEYIMKMIKEAGICYGIKEANIQKLLNNITNQISERILIAEGDYPLDGENAKFESLIQNRGRELLLVRKNDSLMRRIPATIGKAGKNIFGFMIPAKSGLDFGFNKSIVGARVLADNLDLLVASNSGIAIIGDNKVDAESVLELGNVNLSTGNINYTGSVIIRGDVSNGMIVNATGNIYIYGDVDKASIIAGGDIIVYGGVTGGRVDIANLKKEYSAVLKSGGKISIKYLEYSEVFARKNIHIKEYSLHNRVYSKDRIKVGDEENIGHVIGGFLRADKYIEVGIVGNNYNTQAKLIVESHAGNIRITNHIKHNNIITLGGLPIKLENSLKSGRFINKLGKISFSLDQMAEVTC